MLRVEAVASPAGTDIQVLEICSSSAGLHIWIFGENALRSSAEADIVLDRIVAEHQIGRTDDSHLRYLGALHGLSDFELSVKGWPLDEEAKSQTKDFLHDVIGTCGCFGPWWLETQKAIDNISSLSNYRPLSITLVLGDPTDTPIGYDDEVMKKMEFGHKISDRRKGLFSFDWIITGENHIDVSGRAFELSHISGLVDAPEGPYDVRSLRRVEISHKKAGEVLPRPLTSEGWTLEESKKGWIFWPEDGLEATAKTVIGVVEGIRKKEIELWVH